MPTREGQHCTHATKATANLRFAASQLPRTPQPTSQQQPNNMDLFALSSEPILFPKLRIYIADFPYSHCSIDQRLFTLETCCGYEYGSTQRRLVRYRSLRFSRDNGYAPDVSKGETLCQLFGPISDQFDSRVISLKSVCSC